jgi:hypothetical protein
METNQKNRKKQKIGNLIISEEIMSVQCCQNLEKKIHVNVHNFIKNSNSIIFPQTGFSQFWILAFKKFWDPMEKSDFFQKKQNK